MAYSDALRKAVRKYQDKNIKKIGIDLNINTDKDILDYLETKANRTAYLKELIRNDMKGSNKPIQRD